MDGLKKYSYGVLAEEAEDSLLRLQKERVWMIDPLDGTKDFLAKTGEFSIMVGLAHRGKPVLGVVYQPLGDKIYFAVKGEGAFVKESGKPSKKLTVSNVANFSDARFLLSRFHFGESEKEFTEKNKIKNILQIGSLGLKAGMIAKGKAEAMFNFSDKTKQWDTCAAEVILREAGGEITDSRGEKFVYNRKEVRNLNGVVATNGKIHQQIIRRVSYLYRNFNNN